MSTTFIYLFIYGLFLFPFFVSALFTKFSPKNKIGSLCPFYHKVNNELKVFYSTRERYLSNECGCEQQPPDTSGRALFELKGFMCASTREKLPADRFNDDYCDCPADGSDEPGTSACANGRFWCTGEKHYLPTSLVDDGICDCCDGSDEPLARQCPNTCATYHAPSEDPYSVPATKHNRVYPPHPQSVGTGRMPWVVEIVFFFPLI